MNAITYVDLSDLDDMQETSLAVPSPGVVCPGLVCGVGCLGAGCGGGGAGAGCGFRCGGAGCGVLC